MQKHIDQFLGTVVGTVSGIITAWDVTRFADELNTIKLAAIGAVTGFLITSIIKWVVNKFSNGHKKVH